MNSTTVTGVRVHPCHTKFIQHCLTHVDKEMVLDAFNTQGETEQHAELNSSTQSRTSTHRGAGFKLGWPNT